MLYFRGCLFADKRYMIVCRKLLITRLIFSLERPLATTGGELETLSMVQSGFIHHLFSRRVQLKERKSAEIGLSGLYFAHGST